jgi:hypothetical protein
LIRIVLLLCGRCNQNRKLRFLVSSCFAKVFEGIISGELRYVLGIRVILAKDGSITAWIRGALAFLALSQSYSGHC